MAFKLENFGAEVANAKSTLGGICYYRYFNEENNTLTTAGYFPATLGLEVGDRIRVIPATKTDADEIYIVTSTANRTVTVTQVDTDGAVDSVNGKTGTVVLDASDVGALPSSTVIPDAIQVSTMPTASATEEGKIYQYIGATDATYTNGYFYKCTGAGEPVVYSWTQVNVQPPSGLPDQTGNAGKFLTTDGTDASWSDKPLVNVATGTSSLNVGGDAGYANAGFNTIVGTSAKVGYNQYSFSSQNTVIGGGATLRNATGCVVIGRSAGDDNPTQHNYSIAIGNAAKIGADYAIQLGGNNQTNSDANTFKVANSNGNFEIMSADGTIPAARHASLPAADGTYVLKLVIASGVPTLSWVAE